MTQSLLAFVSLLGILTSPVLADEHVVGGYNATVAEYPYISFLSVERAGGNFYTCTGSVIGPRTIITAAHCVQDTISGTVRIGSSYSDRQGRVISTTGYDEHPQYNRQTFTHDIALLYTSEDTMVNGNYVQRALLPTSNSSIQAGQAIQLAGFGRLAANRPGASEQLQQTLLQVDTKADCKAAHAPTPITNEEVCVTSRVFYQGSASCPGDSGGPYTDPSKKYILAVNSFGPNDCTADRVPDVGITTFYTMNFITKNIR